MYRIIDGRGSGKTSRLMLIAKENNATFVCSNPRAMEAKAHAYGIVGINFLDYYTYLTSRGKKLEKIVIDEMESFIQYAKDMYCAQGTLIGYTLTDGD